MDIASSRISTPHIHIAARVVPLLFTFALLVRVLVVFAYAGDMPHRSDPDWYYVTAANVAAGQGFTLNGVPTATYTAGYPLVLAGLFALIGQPSIMAAQLLNLALSMIALIYGYKLVREATGERSARFALLFMALYPSFIGHSAMLLSEPLHMAMANMGLYLLYQTPRRPLWGSMALAVATVTRPQMALIIPAFWLWCWLSRRLALKEAARYGAMCMLIAASLTGLWMVRNALYIGAPVLSTSEGMNLWIGNHANAYGGYSLTLNPPVGLSELEASRWYTEQTLDDVRANLLRAIVRIPAKWAALYTTDDFPIWYLPMHPVLGALTDLAIPLLLACALMRVGLTIFRRQRLATFALITPLATLATVTPFFGTGRFNLLALFWVAALAVSARSVIPPPPSVSPESVRRTD